MNYTVIQETEFYQGKCTSTQIANNISPIPLISNLRLCHTSQQNIVLTLSQHGEIEAYLPCNIWQR